MVYSWRVPKVDINVGISIIQGAKQVFPILQGDLEQ